MNKKYFVMTLLVFVVALMFRIYYIGQKQGFHMDEMLSRVIITGKAAPVIDLLYSQKTFMTGNEYINYLFNSPNPSLVTDLKNLRKYNYADDSHPSLYYSLLRIVLEFSQNSPKGFINAGCGLNIIFFIFSFFVMQKLLLKLFGDNKLVPIGLGIAFLNTGSISMTLFIRPYELQMLAVILISYVFVLVLEKINSNQSLLTFKNIFILSASLAFTFLSGYLIVLYVAMLGGILLFQSRKNLKNFSILCLSVLLAVGLTCLINSGYFNFLSGQRFDNVSSSKGFLLSDYIINLISYFCNLCKYIFYPFVILLCVVFGFFVKKYDIKFALSCLLIVSLVWSIVVAMTVPFPVFRYISPISGILCLGILLILERVDGKKQLIFGVILLVVYILSAMYPLKKEANDTYILYNNDKKFHMAGVCIENLFISKYPKLNSKIPVVIQNRFWYTPLYVFSKLDNEQKYLSKTVENDILNLTNYNLEHFYLFVDNAFQQVKFNPDVKIEYIGDFAKYKCYEIIKKS
jgi:hypothetical protein